MSFVILKRTEIVPEEDLQNLKEFVRAEEKGYPSILHPLKIVAEFDDETNKLKGYTSFRKFDRFNFVGNSYVFDREGGTFKKVLTVRDKHLGSSKPKITLLNPIEGTDLGRLSSYVESRGGRRIENYSQVDDVMDESMYNEMKRLPMYRYPPYKEEVKKWQEVLKAKATATHNSKGEKKDRCAKLADEKYGMKSSAYKSGFIVRCRRGKVSKE